MFNISRNNIIIISCICAVIISSCGYSIISKKIRGNVTVKGNIQEVNSKDVYGEKQQNSNNKNKEILVHIIGMVKNPGLVSIPEGGRISDAIKAAGGVMPDADLEIINLAYKLEDGKQIYIPSMKERNGESRERKVQSPDSTAKRLVPGVQPDAPPPSKADAHSGEIDNFNQKINSLVNINTADEKTLDTLPGIGSSTAKKIIEYRNTGGKFNKPEDIMNVKGIGKSKYEKIKSMITV